ncbi:MAG: 4Fe-4S dicluster domain-containing protein [Candidatus Hadarchaeales archaeon]
MHKILPKENLRNFFEKLKELGEVHAPVRRGTIFAFSKIESVEQIEFSYVRTMIPPKKYFIQTCEEILRFTPDKGYSPATTETKKVVLFGVHACDINAIKILDNVFLEEPVDLFYEERRKNTFIVGISCEPDDFCFCKSVGADSVQDNYDLFLYDLGDRYLIDTGSRAGEEFLLSLNLQNPTSTDFEVLRKMLSERDLKFKKTLNAQGLAQIVDSNPSSEVWGRYAEKCLACGGCTLVCPTCRCYSIDEFRDLSLEKSTRTRRWDSCFLRSHALVAGGLNFRPTRLDRFRHRYNCKSSIEWKSGGLFCVGCGRCSAFCPAGIDHVEVLNNLVHLSVMTI